MSRQMSVMAGKLTYEQPLECMLGPNKKGGPGCPDRHKILLCCLDQLHERPGATSAAAYGHTDPAETKEHHRPGGRLWNRGHRQARNQEVLAAALAGRNKVIIFIFVGVEIGQRC